jgi:hypothetical protein
MDAVAELEAAGWLAIKKRRTYLNGVAKGGRSQTNAFSILFEKARNGARGAQFDGAQNAPFHPFEDPLNGALCARNGAESVTLTNEEHPSLREGGDDESHAFAGAGAGAYAPRRSAEEDFDEFWRHYSKRVGIEAARREFSRAVDSGKATAAAIIQAAKAYVASTPSQFLMRPAKWLHGGHYADEPPSPAVAASGATNPFRKSQSRKSEPFSDISLEDTR